MPAVKRDAVIYRRGLNKMSIDKNKGKPGYAPCVKCERYARILPSGLLMAHNMHARMKNRAVCLSRQPEISIALVSLNLAGVGQQRIADIYGVSRHKVRTALKEYHAQAILVDVSA